MDSTNYKKYTTKNPLRARLIKNFLNTLNQNVSDLPNSNILEIGCGEGFIADSIKQNIGKYNYYGFDISKESVEMAQENLPEFKFEVKDILDTEPEYFNKVFNGKKIDIVLMLEVLEHIEDYEKALQKVSKIDFEYFIISCPNEPFFRLSNLIALKNVKRLGNDVGHVNNWNMFNFKKLIGKHFDIQKSNYPYPWQMLICKKKS